MKVSSSPYLEKARPLLKELLSQLLKEYEYASVLATDSHSKRYSVSGSGVQATPDRWLTKRGLVVRVMDKGRYG